MPPPASNQGSRAALVTWTVVSCIHYVTATVFAIYFYVSSSKITQLDKTNREKYGEIVDEAAIAGPDVTALHAAKSVSDNPAIPGLNPSMKLLEVAVALGMDFQHIRQSGRAHGGRLVVRAEKSKKVECLRWPCA